MAQLSDDCFAPGSGLLSVDEALARIDDRVVPVVGSETLPLRAVPGRILAEEVVARINLPPHANSAVDGFALRHADLAPDCETELPIGGRAAAGHPLDRPIRPGEAIRIFTGAPMPEGADSVMMQEDCVVSGDRVRLRAGIRKGANLRHAGEDVAAGETALTGGTRLGPAEIGLAAALGRRGLRVYRSLRVALLSTGDEVREPGAELPPGMIYDANRFMLATLLERLGCTVSDLGIAPDREAALVDLLAGASTNHDLIVTSGGVSTGDEDHIKAAVERLGALYFWRLAIKPGRPVALGRVGEVPLIGLPGNPVAAAVTFAVLARSLILKLAGAAASPPRAIPARAGFAYRKKPGRREYLRARLQRDGDAIIAAKYPRDGAGILSSIVRSDGLVVLDEATSDLRPGTTIDFLPFAEVFA
jgi:molybdopterin molybdotransferase